MLQNRNIALILVLLIAVISTLKIFSFDFLATRANYQDWNIPAVLYNSNNDGLQGNKWERLSSVNTRKNILVWENSWGFRFGGGASAFINAGCRVSNCFLSFKKKNNSLLNYDHIDAFVVHPMTQRSPWILENRRSDQIFIMFSTEPPHHLPDLKLFENYFNWTMTYRSGSTFDLKYGEILPLETAPKTPVEAAEMRDSFVRMTGIHPGIGKNRSAIWLVSNCNAPSNRQIYVNILSQYMQVDIFSDQGKCGGNKNRTCPRSQNADLCYDLIERDYKFYLSFENSICAEYVTEKFFEMMSRNILPVVLGGADYSTIAPPHSYINALDYTPRELADYLVQLDRNETLYAEYFWWKPHYRVRNLYDTNRQAFCALCEALHISPLKYATAFNLNKWYKDDSNCTTNLLFQET